MDLYKRMMPALFKLDPERANAIAEAFLRASESLPLLLKPFIQRRYEDESLSSDVFGSNASNPLGLAAGFDKNAELIAAAHMLGFGFTEVGTVTLEPQKGNERPRLFRYPKDQSLQNMMGFNNCGVEKFAKNLARGMPTPIPVGISLGRSKATPNESAIEDYSKLAKLLGSYASYIAINLSSPNTKGLRDLENAEFVADAVREVRRASMKPVLVKISPDNPASHIVEIGHAVFEARGDGIIATNTTRDFAMVSNSKMTGGISGVALRRSSRNALKALYSELGGGIKIISVGGIDSAEEAYLRLLNGASFLQLYTALIFRGPGVANSINMGLAALLRKNGYERTSDAVGAALPR